MANETFRTKGAIEPDSTFSSSSNAIHRWKGAIEPQPAVAGANPKGPLGMPLMRPLAGPL